MKVLTECPVCRHSDFKPLFTCEDHTVSHETFQLTTCEHCGLVMTNPRPDDDQLEKYYQSDAYISHSNKTFTITDRVYKVARAFTLNWKYKLIHRHAVTSPQSVLDFGCGTGSFLRTCKERGMNISGVEPSEGARRLAVKATGADIAASLDNITDRYDVITLWHVLEHVSDFNDTILQLKSKLAENGTIFIAVPNLNSLDAKTYKQHWAGYDVPRHLWHFSIHTMGRILSQNQLRVTDIIPMKLDSFYVSMLSEKYRDPNARGSLVNAVFQGLNSNRAAKKTGEYSSLIYTARK